MKFAVCISGHMREYKKTFHHLKNKILNKFDCDIFIHTWEDNITNWSTVANLYNPTKLCVEKLIDIQDSYENKHRTSHGEFTNINIIGMYYKIFSCNSLKKEQESFLNKKYDCVIRYRPDLVIKQTIPIDELNNLEHVYAPTVGGDRWIDDTFAFSNSDNMDYYSQTYNNLNELYEVNNKSLHPECILRKNLDKYNIKYKETIVKSGTLREDGTVMGHTFHVPYESIL